MKSNLRLKLVNMILILIHRNKKKYKKWTDKDWYRKLKTAASNPQMTLSVKEEKEKCK